MYTFKYEILVMYKVTTFKKRTKQIIVHINIHKCFDLQTLRALKRKKIKKSSR